MSVHVSAVRSGRQARADDQRTSAALFGANPFGSPGPDIFRCIFDELGFPRHRYGIVQCASLEVEPNPWRDALRQPDCLGTCVSMPLKLQAFARVDRLTEEAQATGCVNTTFFLPSNPADDTAPLLVVGTNTDSPACRAVLLSHFLALPLPFPPSSPCAFSAATKAAAFVIGSGGATRAAIHALHHLGCSPIFVVNRDISETEDLLQHFASWNVSALSTADGATEALDALERNEGHLVCGVGAIPCAKPETAGELAVYEIAETIFSRRYAGSIAQVEKNSLPLPTQRVFVDMAYKPLMTDLRKSAEEHGWRSICGTEVVLENCFAQCELWTGIEVPAAIRQKARKLLEY